MKQILPWWIFYEICFSNIFHISEAGWSWNRPHHHGHQHHHQHQHNHHRAPPQGKGCVKGYCTKRWECPTHAVALQPTGACAYLRRDAGWICCYKGAPGGPHNDWNDQPRAEEAYSGRSRGGRGPGVNNHNHHPAIYTPQPTSWWQSYSYSPSLDEEDNELYPPNRGPRKHWKTNEGKNWKNHDGRNWKGNDDKHWKSKITPRTTEWLEGPSTEPYQPEVPQKRTTVSSWFKPKARTRKVFWPEVPRVSKVTTPVPNINERICGYREVAPVLSRLEEYKEFVETAKKFTDAKKIPFAIDAIVGGEEAEPYSWPWVAALYRETETGRRRFLSAGSLINTNFILTAAHVFKSQDIRSPSFMVFLGTHTTDDAVAVYRVRSVLQHPEYQARFYYHDIALLRLQSPVLFNDYVMPVCLPSPSSRLVSEDLTGRDVTVTGWGDQSFGGVSSRVLKEATFPVVSREACNASYIGVASSRFPRGITKEMLCAGDPGGGKDACQGDSGGPLMIRNGDRYTQVGIVSFGYQCGDKDYPGVYTRVAPYLKWINQNTEGVEDYYVE